MSFSMNEVESLSKLAARGAGYSWGLAEEAAKATRWLSSHNVDGCRALVNVLTLFDCTNTKSYQLNIDGNTWSSNGELLCPVTTGSYFSDYSSLLETQAININDLVEPIIFLFFASQFAKCKENTVSLTWSVNSVITDGYNTAFCLSGSKSSIKQNVLVKFSAEKPKLSKLQTRAEPQPEVWHKLRSFAARTYAPNTEQSRIGGAGAGLSDND